jgi:DNA-binding transcriptional regulator PaaX
MVTYDVPRTKAAERRLFVDQLKRLGFTMVRESVWFHPFPCFDELSNLAAYCGIVRHVTFGEIDRLDTVTREKLRRAYLM